MFSSGQFGGLPPFLGGGGFPFGGRAFADPHAFDDGDDDPWEQIAAQARNQGPGYARARPQPQPQQRQAAYHPYKPPPQVARRPPQPKPQGPVRIPAYARDAGDFVYFFFELPDVEEEHIKLQLVSKLTKIRVQAFRFGLVRNQLGQGFRVKQPLESIIELPHGLDANKVDAEFDSGILALRIAKLEVKAIPETKDIPLRRGATSAALLEEGLAGQDTPVTPHYPAQTHGHPVQGYQEPLEQDGDAEIDAPLPSLRPVFPDVGAAPAAPPPPTPVEKKIKEGATAPVGTTTPSATPTATPEAPVSSHHSGSPVVAEEKKTPHAGLKASWTSAGVDGKPEYLKKVSSDEEAVSDSIREKARQQRELAEQEAKADEAKTKAMERIEKEKEKVEAVHKLVSVQIAVDKVRADNEQTAFKLCTSPPDAEVKGARTHYSQGLLKQMLELDSVETHGIEALRHKRKVLVCHVQRLLDALEAHQKTEVELQQQAKDGDGDDDEPHTPYNEVRSKLKDILEGQHRSGGYDFHDDDDFLVRAIVDNLRRRMHEQKK